jgi:hypothetical protein
LRGTENSEEAGFPLSIPEDYPIDDPKYESIAPFLILATTHLGVAIIIEASLGFLGVGIPPPNPTWGNMLSDALNSGLVPPWWLVLFPGAAITLTVLAFNLLGDGIRDMLEIMRLGVHAGHSRAYLLHPPQKLSAQPLKYFLIRSRGHKPHGALEEIGVGAFHACLFLARHGVSAKKKWPRNFVGRCGRSCVNEKLRRVLSDSQFGAARVGHQRGCRDVAGNFRKNVQRDTDRQRDVNQIGVG